MPSTKAGRQIAAVILLVGAILLVVALVTPWYSYGASVGGLGSTGNFYPGTPSTNGTVRFVCTGLPSCLPQSSYTRQGLNQTGIIAETGFFLIIAGFVLGILAAVLGLASRGNARRASPALALAVVALVLAIAAPGLFAVALPGAIKKDTPSGHPANGPWNSFFGSNSTSAFGVSVTSTWGPAIGWYLSIGAFVLLLIGVILLARYRKDPPEPVPVAWTPAPVASPAGSPATPPVP